MPVTREFTEMLADMLAPLGPVAVRRMFGGAGLFSDGLMFALLADDTLYLKADDISRAAFEREGLGAFTYATASGKRSVMSYWRAPERLLDDADEMQTWCRAAMAAAARSRSSTRSKGTAGAKGAAKSGVVVNTAAPTTTASSRTTAPKMKAGRKRPAR